MVNEERRKVSVDVIFHVWLIQLTKGFCDLGCQQGTVTTLHRISHDDHATRGHNARHLRSRGAAGRLWHLVEEVDTDHGVEAPVRERQGLSCSLDECCGRGAKLLVRVAQLSPILVIL